MYKLVNLVHCHHNPVTVTLALIGGHNRVVSISHILGCGCSICGRQLAACIIIGAVLNNVAAVNNTLTLDCKLLTLIA